MRACAAIAQNLAEAGYTEAEAAAVQTEAEFYADIQAAIKKHSGEELDIKPYEADMRRLLNTYVQADPAQAEEQARKLATDPQVMGVIGNWLEPTTLAAAPPLAASNIPFLATASSPDLDPSAFRLWPTESTLEAAVPEATFCPNPCDSLEDLDWLTSTRSVQPPTSNLQLAGPPLWGLTQFPRLAGSAAEGAYVITPSPLPADSADPTFADRYLAVSPGVQPRFLAVLAYDVTQLLFTAIRQDIEANGSPTRAGVEAALAQLSFSGLSGQLSFNAGRDWAEASGWLYQWQGGQLIGP